jgi:hypothetical protein
VVKYLISDFDAFICFETSERENVVLHSTQTLHLYGCAPERFYVFYSYVIVAEGLPDPLRHYLTSAVDRGWLSNRAINTVLFATNTFGLLAQVGQACNLFYVGTYFECQPSYRQN